MLKGLLLSGKTVGKNIWQTKQYSIQSVECPSHNFFYLDRIFQHNVEIFKTWTYLNALG